MRLLANALNIRFRAEVAEGRFDDGIKTAKTMLAMARSFDKFPGKIPNLYGCALAMIALGPVEEMIQQPGCPNLYWALTSLPSPLIDSRLVFQGEQLYFSAEFGGIDLEEPMAQGKLERIRTRLCELLFSQIQPGHAGEEWLDGLAKDSTYLREARDRLRASGIVNDQVKDFPPMQIVLLDERREFEHRLHEGGKWLALPFWQAEAPLRALVQPKGTPKNPERFRLDFLKVKIAQARVERKIALLRTVEALRLYAADHDGKLPERLEDLSVPVPIDPVHGKPFDYKLNGGVALIQATSPPGFEASPRLQYAILIKK